MSISRTRRFRRNKHSVIRVGVEAVLLELLLQNRQPLSHQVNVLPEVGGGYEGVMRGRERCRGRE